MSKFSEVSRRSFVVRGSALACVSGIGLVSPALAAVTPDKTRLMNAVSLGFIDQDGVKDAIPALRAFIAACQAKGQTAGYLPGVASNKRGYRYMPVTTWYNHPERGLLIPPNFTLIGDDPTTSRFFQDPSAFNGTPVTWPAYAFIFYSSGSSLQNLGFDGQKQLVRGGAETSFCGTFIKAAEQACKNAYFKNLYLTGNIGGLQESFCISTSPQENGTIFDTVACVNNNGTGISLNGDMLAEIKAPGTGLNRNIVVLNCTGSGNTWQGITAYGCQDTLISNFTGTGNGATKRWAGNGVNLEWTYRMHVAGGKFVGNVGAGIGGYGDNDQVTIDSGFVTSANNTMRSWKSAEISFAGGTWWDTSKGSVSGLLRNMTIRNGTIQRIAATGSATYDLQVDTKDMPVITYPSRGAPFTPRVLVSKVAPLALVSDWKLTPFTNPSIVSVG